jgi:tungstate transport system ATP-binding protein
VSLYSPPLSLSAKKLIFMRDSRVIINCESLEIKKGELVVLTGPNGSGKTTLLKILAGLIPADSGHFTLGESSSTKFETPRYLIGKCIYLHQTPYMFQGSVVRNLSYGLRKKGVKNYAIDGLVDEAVKKNKLGHLTKRMASTLSAGEQHQVALARAQILKPPVLLLDEVTAHMDQKARGRTFEIIETLQKEGISIILATHDDETIKTLSGTGTRMNVDSGYLTL